MYIVRAGASYTPPQTSSAERNEDSVSVAGPYLRGTLWYGGLMGRTDKVTYGGFRQVFVCWCRNVGTANQIAEIM